ncbi:MAG: protein translocase subunit SecD, partial [Verrucomicrobia bacterium]|nr:protein translocase subunit SecD [Verrucomicrobiota bacterium]
FPSYDVSAELDPNRAILNRIQRAAAGRIKLGIDLRGGTAFLVEMETNNVAQGTEQNALNHAVEVLRKRVDQFGVAEPIIQPSGENRIQVQIPGLSEADKLSARAQLEKAAFLKFCMVHPQNDELVGQGMGAPGYELMKLKTRNPKAPKDSLQSLLVKRQAEMTGESIKDAAVYPDPTTGQPQIHFRLNSEGAALFGRITSANIGQRLAIVLDGELRSAPVIQGAITGGSGQITGDFDLKEAYELANVLQNPLKAPVKILAENGVDPSLGKDAIDSGIKASLYGTAAVAVFMAVYYLSSGLIANVALMANIVILIGVMCSFGTTLTLPGIAGIVLTIGMSVDANVLIFERIREELGKGKSLRGALSAGYDRAFGTIFDSHVTTLISSIILIYMGTGPIKGFGVTLTIGVSASLFTALVITRLIFDFLIAKNIIKSLPMMHLIKNTKLDFMKLAKPAFILSWAIILVGLGYGAFVRGHKVFGIDFAGGDNLTMSFVQKVDPEKLRHAVTGAGVSDPSIQYQRDISTGSETLRVTSTFGTGDKVETELAKQFPEAKFKRVALDKIGPVIGKEIQATALGAGLLSLFGILVYVAFRYEFSFAIGAVVAILHDVLMTIGCYFLAGRELNATMVAAVLTIIGFSINDTVVIFDRIREDLKLGVRGTFRELINQALNQTLSRTIITSGTVFLATLSLYIFGGGAINDFAFTFLVGIITGTYSSIYIASALVLWWHKGQRPKNASAVMMADEQPVAAKA